MKSKTSKLLAIIICAIVLWTINSKADCKSGSLRTDSTGTIILLQLDSLMKISKSNGILIINGEIIKEWSYDKPNNMKIETQSITKAIVSLLLGIAIDEGKINDINNKVYNYYPAFNVGPHTQEITFKHLVTVSSGIEAKKYKENYANPNNMAPGIDARYHNDHFHQLATVLTYIFEKPLIQVLEEKILSKLNASVEWRSDGEVILKNGNKIPINAGYAFSKWTASDLAKIGQLYLNQGLWNRKRLLSKQYIENSLTPIDVPLMISRPNQEVREDKKNTYGYGWRGIILSNDNILWHMSGNGGQFCAIVPSKNLVFVKINGHSNDYKPYRGLSYFKDYILSMP